MTRTDFKDPRRKISAIYALGAALLFVSFQTPAQSTTQTNIITIEKGSKVATLINVFTVDPPNRQKLIDLFEQGTSDLFSKQPGFIALCIHKSADGKQVVLYGQWRSKQDIDNFRTVPEIQTYFKKVKELSVFESVVCDEVTNIHTVQ